MNLDAIIEANLTEKSAKSEKVNKVKIENVKYKRIEDYVVLKTTKNWSVSLSLVQWGDNEAKYEIRKWKIDGTAGKGITLTKDQMKQFVELIKEKEFEF